MTAGGDFIPTGDENGLEGPGYPKFFGLTITPVVGGAILALLGLGGAVWLWLNVVQGTLQTNRELKQDVENKEQQLLNQEETQQQIAEARERLAESRQLQQEVLSLFATEQSLDTLLLDVNERVQSANANIQDPDRRASLVRFELDEEASGEISDSTYGAAVNNKLQRRVYNVEMRGSYPQTVSIVRNIERLQPLLVVQDLNSQLDQSTQRLVLDSQGRIVPTGQPETRVNTTFTLSALVPIESEPPAAPETAAGEESPDAEASPSPSP